MKKLFIVVAFFYVAVSFATEVNRALTFILPSGYTVNYRDFIGKESKFITEKGEVSPVVSDNLLLPRASNPYTKAVVFYATVDRFEKGVFEVKGCKSFKAYLDGKEIKNNSDIALTTGKHRFLIVFFSDGKEERKISINLKDIDCKISTDYKKFVSHEDYIDFWYPYYITSDSKGNSLAAVVSSRDSKGKRKVETMVFPDGNFSNYLSFPGCKSPVFSKDGRFLVFLKKNEILKLNLETLQLSRVFKSKKSVSNLVLSDDGKIVYFMVSDTFKEKKKDYAVLEHLYEKTPFYKTKNAIFSVSIDGKTFRKIADPDYIDAFTVGFNKVVIFTSKLLDSYPWAKTVVYEKDLTYLKERKVGEYNFGSENPVGSLVFYDENTVYFTAQRREYDEKRLANYYDNSLYRLSLDSGTVENLTEKEAFTVGIDIIYAYQTSSTFEKFGKDVYFIATENGEGVVYRFSVEKNKAEKVDLKTDKLCTGFCKTESGMFVLASDFSSFPALYKDGKKLFVFEPESLQKRIILSPYRYFNFKSQTGYSINNYLIYPKGYNPDKKYPMIVFYYGGVVPCGKPFHPTFQYLAGNGYFVFLTTPRGAVGRGEKFAAEHCNEWGEKSAADLIEATKWICKKVKAIDSERLGAYSGSYGGFLANTLAYKTNIFKALVSEYGISNIASYWGGGYWGYLYGMTALHGTYPWNAKEVYVDKSPLFNADKVKTPLLLMHGTADVNVPSLESDQFFTALKVLGKDCVYIRFFGEDHGMKGKFENWLAQENFLIGWFDKYLKGDSSYWDYLVEKNRGKITHKPFKDYFIYGEKTK